MTLRSLQFLAILLSALALIPSGAHLAALPNKIGMAQADYFTVQGIYSGWAILGWLWPLALAMNAGLAVASRAQHWPFWSAVLASLCYVLMLVVFLIWTQPANQATQNWTIMPENWQLLRQQWECSHAVNAVIAVLALGLTAISALSWRN